MKRVFIAFFVMAILGMTALWALQGNANDRNYNRNSQWKSDTNANPNYASCIGSDSDGGISAYASITVDVDRPLENSDDEWWKIQPNGVDYSAYANIWADSSTGSWSVSATVPGDMDGTSGIVNGDTYRETSASDFEWIWGDPGHVEDHIGNASSSGTVSLPGFRSEARAEDFGVIGDS